MNTSSSRQKMMAEEAGIIPLILSVIQEILVKKIQKVGNEQTSYKQDIITAVENVESRADKRLMMLEEQRVVNKDMVQLSNRVQWIGANIQKQKEQLVLMTEAFKRIKKGFTEQGQIEDLFQQAEN